MIITDYNKMTPSELNTISKKTGIEFQINDGRIVGTVKKSEN